MRLIPNLQIFAWHFQVMSTFLVCQLDGKWKRKISKWNWPRRSRFTSFLGKQNKVSQEDLRNVFSLTRLELLHSRLSAAFASWNRQCQPLTFCASSSYMLPCDVSAGWFFQEAVPLCSLAACKVSQNYSHQEPVQHNSSRSPTQFTVPQTFPALGSQGKTTGQASGGPRETRSQPHLGEVAALPAILCQIKLTTPKQCQPPKRSGNAIHQEYLVLLKHEYFLISSASCILSWHGSASLGQIASEDELQ